MEVLYNIIFGTAISFLISCNNEKPVFTEKIIDDQAPANLWMKSTGDINLDGKADILVGGWQTGGIVAYLAPDWRNMLINDLVY